MNQMCSRSELFPKQKAPTAGMGKPEAEVAPLQGRQVQPMQPNARYMVFLMFISFSQSSRFLFVFNHMAYRHKGWWKIILGRKTHDRSNALPHLRPIAMHLAVGAEGFRLHKGASVTALPGIPIQGGALGG